MFFTNFNYIYFFILLNQYMRKSFSLTFFFFSYYFLGTKYILKQNLFSKTYFLTIYTDTFIP